MRRVSRLFHSSAFRFKLKPFMLADIGEGITECEVIQWFVKPGDRVSQFDRVCEVQSDKAAVEITSRFDGTISKLYYSTGDMAKVGSPLVDIDTEEGDAANTTDPAQGEIKHSHSLGKNDPNSSKNNKETPTRTVDKTSGQTLHQASQDLLKPFATPAVRRIARENQIDLTQVPSTGKNGRILKEDILAFVSEQAEPAPSTAPPPPSTTSHSPLTAIQKAMFKSMTKSLQIPHFGFSEEINMTACSVMRENINSLLIKGGFSVSKISFMPVMMKAMSLAILQHPILNACLVEENGQPFLKYRSSHNIGIAMDTPNGLMVPNVKQIESKSIIEIAVELERLKRDGSQGKLSPSDLSGGTITLSNIGNIGGTVLHPVIVSSEVCIGAIGRIQKLPRFINVKSESSGNESEIIQAQFIMQSSWNADHRVIDGATMARFVTLWKKYLEDPSTMTISLK